MHHALRRTAIIVASSAVVLSGAPLLGTALATSTLTQSSVTPTSGTPVQDSHPAISAAYTDGGNPATLDPSSTITVTGGPTTVACDSNGTVSGNTITCNYPSSPLLKSGTYTITVDAVEASNTSNTAHNTSTFTVNVPTISAATPPVNGRVQSFSSVSVTYDKSIDDANSKITVQQVADKTGTNTYTPASHTPLTGTTTFVSSSTGMAATLADMKTDSNQNDTIVFTPSSAPVNKGIYQVTLDVFGTDNASNGVTTPDGPVLKAESKDTYTFTMDDPPPPPPPPPSPTNLLESPDPVTGANKATVTFSGNGTPGDTIVVDASDGTHHFNNSGTTNGGPVAVPTCPSTTSCAWSKVFDYTSSGLNDGPITWTATETAAQNSTSFAGSSTPATGPSFTKDVNPPAPPHVAGTFPNNPTTLHVVGSSDQTADRYTLDIHDIASPNHVLPTITLTKAHGDINADGTFATDVDVSSLDDGTISMSLVAFDVDNNASSTATATAMKASNLQLVFNQSTFRQTNADSPSFPTVNSRPGHGVQPLAQIAVVFSNPIVLIVKDTGVVNPTDTVAKDPQFVEVLPNGADGNTFIGKRIVDPNNSRQLLVTPPPGLADGTYKLSVEAFQQGKCGPYDSDPLPPGTGAVPTCDPKWHYNNYVLVPDTATPFTFTVDSVPPSAPTISTLPEGTIDGSNVGDVLVRGTAPGGASFVTLTAKSSGGGPVLALNGGQAVPVEGNGNWQDEESSGAFAALTDGTITISATAADGAGNTSPTTTHTVVLAARPSIPRSLGVSATSTSFTLRWQIPSYDGYPAQNGNATSHLTGYRYTYQDKTPGAVDTAVHSVNVANAAATSVTQAGLLTGHSYAVTLCAVNNISGPCNVVNTTAMPAYVTSLTESINHSVVVYGSSIILSGRLTRHDIGAGLAGQPLTIQPRFDNGTTGTVIHITTNSTGNYAVTISKPAKNALYVVAYNATHANLLYQPATASVRSLVEVSMRIDTVKAASSSHTSPVTIAGHVAPNEAGRSVLMYVKVAGGTRYQRLGYVKISSSSTWSFVHTFAPGRYYVIATFGSQNGVTGGHSQTVTITRA